MASVDKSSASVQQEGKCRYALISTDLGWAGVLVSSKGIRRLALPQQSSYTALEYLHESKPIGIDEAELGSFPDIEERLQRYFRGEETIFNDPLDVIGTAFQKKTWEVARTIPRGETRSYGWIARSMGNLGAARAVGQAMRSNPVPIVVPCHRVIGSDGRMCGYGGPEGVDLKRSLLNMEHGD
jgi:methylated-DNA-[protein]-cysteine S-methyltransferase